MASGSKAPDNSIKIWNPNDGSLVRTLTEHTMEISDLIVLTNGHLASSSYDNTVKVWNLVDNNDDEDDDSSMHTIQLTEPCYYMTALSNDRFVCSLQLNTSGLCLMNGNEGTILDTLVDISLVEYPLGLATLNNNGNEANFASCMSSFNKFSVWSVDGDFLAFAKSVEQIDCFTYLTRLNDGNLAAGGTDRLIRIFNTTTEL